MDMSSLAPDVAIASTVQLAAAGDEVAFARIVAAHRAEMVRVAYVVSGDWDLAQDAAQAALWIAWRKLPSLRDPTRLRPWLRQPSGPSSPAAPGPRTTRPRADGSS